MTRKKKKKGQKSLTSPTQPWTPIVEKAPIDNEIIIVGRIVKIAIKVLSIRSGALSPSLTIHYHLSNADAWDWRHNHSQTTHKYQNNISANLAMTLVGLVEWDKAKTHMRDT